MSSFWSTRRNQGSCYFQTLYVFRKNGEYIPKSFDFVDKNIGRYIFGNDALN